jgi:2TM domain
MLTNTAALPTSSADAELRKRARAQVKEKAQFRAHARVYLLVNALHVAIWAAIFGITGAGFFWPIFPALGWGVGLAFHARDVRRPDAQPEVPAEDEIRREMDALRARAELRGVTR